MYKFVFLVALLTLSSAHIIRKTISFAQPIVTAPIVHEVVAAPVVTKVVSAPVVTKVISTPVIHKVVSAPVVTKVISTPVVHKVITHEPTIVSNVVTTNHVARVKLPVGYQKYIEQRNALLW